MGPVCGSPSANRRDGRIVQGSWTSSHHERPRRGLPQPDAPNGGQPNGDGPLGGPSSYHALWAWLFILERLHEPWHGGGRLKLVATLASWRWHQPCAGRRC